MPNNKLKPRLLGLAESVYTRIVRLVLSEKGVGYHFETADVFSHDGFPGDYIKHHPFKRIPAFVHHHLSIYETHAITRYIDETFPGISLQPVSPVHRGFMNQTISVLDSYAYKTMVWDIFVERVDSVEEGRYPDENVIADAIPKAEKCLSVLQLTLGDQLFLLGVEPTLADYHALPMVSYLSLTPEGQSLLDSKPLLQEWLFRLQNRTSFVQTRSKYI